VLIGTSVNCVDPDDRIAGCGYSGTRGQRTASRKDYDESDNSYEPQYDGFVNQARPQQVHYDESNSVTDSVQYDEQQEQVQPLSFMAIRSNSSSSRMNSMNLGIRLGSSVSLLCLMIASVAFAPLIQRVNKQRMRSDACSYSVLHRLALHKVSIGSIKSRQQSAMIYGVLHKYLYKYSSSCAESRSIIPYFLTRYKLI
jgi:hypothetical protein